MFKITKDTKVTPGLFLAFMLLLMAMSAMAVGVGYVAQHMKRASDAAHSK